MRIFEADPLTLGIEMFFTLIIIFCSFSIYYQTREFYNLSEHKGIKYFRKGFLFIGFSHIIMLLNILFKSPEFSFVFINTKLFFGLFGLFFLIGIGFLFSSMYSKYIKEYYIYLLTLSIFTLSLLFQTRTFMLIYSSILIISLGVASFYKLKKSKKKSFSQIYIIYLLVFFSWLISIIGRIITDIPFKGKTLNLVIIAIVFLYILYLVVKKLKWIPKIKEIDSKLFLTFF